MKMKKILFLFIPWLAFLNSVISQDESRYVADLRKAIFPDNSIEELRTTFYGCITKNDSLILYMRKNQPKVKEVIDVLKNITKINDRSHLIDLYDISNQQFRYFIQEWSCGLKQFPLCLHLRDQLRLLNALETSLIAYKIDSLFPSPSDKLKYWRKESDLFYTKMYKLNPFLKESLDNNSIQYLDSLSIEKINEEINSLIFPHEYYRELYIKRNVLWGLGLDWSYMTPFLGQVSANYKKNYSEFQKKKPNNTLEYFLEKYFYEQFINRDDLFILNSK